MAHFSPVLTLQQITSTQCWEDHGTCPGIAYMHNVPTGDMSTGPSEFPGVTIISMCSRKQIHVYRALWVSWGDYNTTVFQETDTCLQGPLSFLGWLQYHCVPGNRYMSTGPSEFPGVTIISLCSRKQMHVYRALWVSWGYYHLTMFQETDTCIGAFWVCWGYYNTAVFHETDTGLQGPLSFLGYYHLTVSQETDTCLQDPLSFLGLLSSHYVLENRCMSTGPSEFPGVTIISLCSRKQIHVYSAFWVCWGYYNTAVFQETDTGLQGPLSFLGYYHLTVSQETDTCLQDPLSFLGLLSSHCVPGNRYMFTGPSEFPRVTIVSVCSRKQIHVYRALWVSWGYYHLTMFQETDTCLQDPLSFLGWLQHHCVPGNRYMSTGPSEFPGVTIISLWSRKQIHVYRTLWVSWGYYHLTVFQETDTCLQTLWVSSGYYHLSVFQETDTCLQGPLSFLGLLSSHCVPGNRYMSTGPSEFPEVTTIPLCSRKQIHVYRALWVSWGYYHLTMFQETDTCIQCLLSLLGLLQYRCVPGNRYRSTGPSKFPGLLSSHCVPGNRYMFTGPSEFPGVTIISLCPRKQIHVYRTLWVSSGYYRLSVFQETDTCLQGPLSFLGLLSSHYVPGNRYMSTGPSEFPGVTTTPLCSRKQIHVYRALWVSWGDYNTTVFQETDTCLQGLLSFLGLLSSHCVPGNRYMSTGPSEFPGVTIISLCSRKQIHVYRALWVSWGDYNTTVFQETDTCLQGPLSFLGLLSSHYVLGNRCMSTGPSEFPGVTIISLCSRKQIHV